MITQKKTLSASQPLVLNKKNWVQTSERTCREYLNKQTILNKELQEDFQTSFCVSAYLTLQLRQLFGQLCLCGLWQPMVQTALHLLLQTFFIFYLQNMEEDHMMYTATPKILLNKGIQMYVETCDGGFGVPVTI